ncbi:MAG: beta-lactamase family protein [Deltaproteobacteria bacterium]|nr:beta-lactamase family protein [Deltaproteobacteria bacterium]
MDANSAPERLGLSGERLARIRTWMQRYVDEAKLPGATTLVARHGEVVFSETLGYGDLEKKKPLTQDSILRFYSMTKPITAVAVMMLYEQGLFQLNDPLATFIPAFNDMQVYRSGSAESLVTEPAVEPITVRDLMTHTSGLTYGIGNEGAVPALYVKHKTEFNPKDGPLEAIVNRLAKIPLEFQPGSRWEYSVSFDVLGRLVEVISGKSLDIFLKENIFDPLGMIDTGFYVPESKLDRFVSLYERTQKSTLSLMESPEDTPLADAVETLSGGGGLTSTLEDYFHFTEMLRKKGEWDGQRLLGRKTVEFMTCNHLPGDLADMGQPTFCETTYEGIGFGLGMSVVLDPAKAKIVGTAGEYAWGGYAGTAFWIDPVEDLTVIFLTQLIPSSAYPIRRELRVLTYQALIA